MQTGSGVSVVAAETEGAAGVSAWAGEAVGPAQAARKRAAAKKKKEDGRILAFFIVQREGVDADEGGREWMLQVFLRIFRACLRPTNRVAG